MFGWQNSGDRANNGTGLFVALTFLVSPYIYLCREAVLGDSARVMEIHQVPGNLPYSVKVRRLWLSLRG